MGSGCAACASSSRRNAVTNSALVPSGHPPPDRLEYQRLRVPHQHADLGLRTLAQDFHRAGQVVPGDQGLERDSGPSGPREILDGGRAGILVPVGEEKSLRAGKPHASVPRT